MADADVDAGGAAVAPMEVEADGFGSAGARNSVEMPLATELTAGAAGIGDKGPEEVGRGSVLCFCVFERFVGWVVCEWWSCRCLRRHIQSKSKPSA